MQLGYLTIFLFPVAVVAGGLAGGGATLLAAGLAFLVIPLLDALCGLDARNPTPDQEVARERSAFYRGVPLAWVPAHWAMLLWTLAQVDAGRPSAWETAGMVLSLGVTAGGIGITVAHELGHKRSRLERAAAHLVLAAVSYLHFYVEHNRGHHVWVATPRDPATARLGQPFWGFFPGTVLRQWLHAWQIEAKELRARGRAPFGPGNRMVAYTLATVALPVALLVVGGWQVALVFLGQSLVAILLLEAVNYIEHYGLLRREVSPGRHEKVTPLHSWNSSHRLTNWVLLHLQRHSDHHANGTRRYPLLRHFDESPQLPFGYPTMVLLALVPPLWRRVMDRRVLAHRKMLSSIVAPGSECHTAPAGAL